MNRFYNLTILVLSLAVFAAACGQPAGPPPEAGLSTAVPSATEEAMVGEEASTAVPDRSANLTILADGVIKVGRPVLALSFQTSGRLLELAVQPGDVVAEGQLLGTLDDAALQDAALAERVAVTATTQSFKALQPAHPSFVTSSPARGRAPCLRPAAHSCRKADPGPEPRNQRAVSPNASILKIGTMVLSALVVCKVRARSL